MKLPFLRSLAVHVLTLSASGHFAIADDSPQWLGPQRDGIWRETGILAEFPKGGPPVRWRTPIGGGYTGPAIAGGRVFVMDRQLAAGAKDPKSAPGRPGIPGTERVLCL